MAADQKTAWFPRRLIKQIRQKKIYWKKADTKPKNLRQPQIEASLLTNKYDKLRNGKLN